MEHDVREIARCDVLQCIQHLSFHYGTVKNVKGGHSAQKTVRKEVGRLGEESSILFLSGYLLKINFTLNLYFASENAEIYEPASDEI